MPRRFGTGRGGEESSERDPLFDGEFRELFHAYFTVRADSGSAEEVWRPEEGLRNDINRQLEKVLIEEAPWKVLENNLASAFTVRVFSRQGSLDILILVFSTGYTLLKDYPSLREGVTKFVRDLERVIKRVFTSFGAAEAESVTVDEKYWGEGPVMVEAQIGNELEHAEMEELSRRISQATIQEVVQSSPDLRVPHGASERTSPLLHWYLLMSNVVLMLLFGFLIAWTIILGKT